MYATERREGEKGVEGKASSRAKCWWEGADQLREVALLLSSPSDFILHAERHFPGSPHTLPHNPQTMEGLSRRSRSKEIQLFFQLGTGGLWITQHSPKAGQKYQNRKMPWAGWQSRAEASLLMAEGWAGQREGLADRHVLLRQNSCQLITYKAVDENKI